MSMNASRPSQSSYRSVTSGLARFCLPRCARSVWTASAPASHFRVLGVSLLLAFVGVQVSAQQQDDAPVRASIVSFMRAHSVPGLQMSVVDGDGQLTTYSYGFADPAENVPVTADTRFMIGSLTKTLVAMMLLRHVDGERLSLDEDVRVRYPWIFGTENSTVRAMLTHRAGYGGYPAMLPPDGIVETFANERGIPPAFDPGSAYSYCNSCYTILGDLLETLEGTTLREAGDRLFAEVGLSSLHLATIEADRGSIALGHIRGPRHKQPHSLRPLVPAEFLVNSNGAASAFGTTADVVRVWSALAGNGTLAGVQLLSPAALTVMRTDYGDNRGLGPVVTVDDQGRTVIQHGGFVEGTQSFAVSDLETQIAVVISVNLEGIGGAHADLARHVLASYLSAAESGEHLAPLVTVAPWIVENAADYVGTFDGERGTLSLIARDGSLFLDDGTAELRLERALGDDAFFVPSGTYDDYMLQFWRNADGTVTDVSHGPNLWFGSAYSGPRAFADDPALVPFEGWYSTDRGFYRGFVKVFQLKGSLHVDTIDDAYAVVQITPVMDYDSPTNGRLATFELDGYYYGFGGLEDGVMTELYRERFRTPFGHRVSPDSLAK
jgi:D-alanyl-D-alanine carboxypeptidase